MGGIAVIGPVSGHSHSARPPTCWRRPGAPFHGPHTSLSGLRHTPLHFRDPGKQRPDHGPVPLGLHRLRRVPGLALHERLRGRQPHVPRAHGRRPVVGADGPRLHGLGAAGQRDRVGRVLPHGGRPARERRPVLHNALRAVRELRARAERGVWRCPLVMAIDRGLGPCLCHPRTACAACLGADAGFGNDGCASPHHSYMACPHPVSGVSRVFFFAVRLVHFFFGISSVWKKH